MHGLTLPLEAVMYFSFLAQQPHNATMSNPPTTSTTIATSTMSTLADKIQRTLPTAFVRSTIRRRSSTRDEKDIDDTFVDESPSTTISSSSFSRQLLMQQNAETSNALIQHFETSSSSQLFDILATFEGDLTKQRDLEDAQKLQRGIDYAISKGVISGSNSGDGDDDFEPYCDIDVLGKTPDEVADEIIQKVVVGMDESNEDDEGSVIVICGLSGTGKGTTVARIRERLAEQKDGKQKVVTWSNGNIFRSITLLAVTWSEQQFGEFQKEQALTKENLESFMGMLSFEKQNNHDGNGDERYDTRIFGLGMDILVSEAENTELKSPKVAKNIPTVAEFTQGEVIVFAANAIETMRRDGWFVLVEGREQTVNHIQSPYRFNLVLSDPTLIGKRRAAQRLMAHASSSSELLLLDKSSDSNNDDEDDDEIVARSLQQSLEELTKDLVAGGC